MKVEIIIEKVFDGFKKITPALIAVLVFTGLILFLPSPVLEKMSLNKLPDLWKKIIGLAFLLCATLLISLLCFSLFKTNTSRCFIKNKIKLTRRLSQEQKDILTNMLKQPDKSILLDNNSGNTIYLLNNGFIYQPQQVVTLGEENEIIIRYIPQAWVMDLYQNKQSFRRLLES